MREIFDVVLECIENQIKTLSRGSNLEMMRYSGQHRREMIIRSMFDQRDV